MSINTEFKVNPSTTLLDLVNKVEGGNSLDTRYIKLDQTAPQTILNGAPIFDAGLVSNDEIIFSDGIGRVTSTGTLAIGVAGTEAGVLIQGLSTTTNALLKLNTTQVASAGFQFGNSSMDWVLTTTTGNDFQIGTSAVKTFRIEGTTGHVSVGGNRNSPAGMLTVESPTTTVPTIVAMAIAAQTSNLTEWQNSSGGILTNITKDGYYYSGNTGTITGVQSMHLNSGGFNIQNFLGFNATAMFLNASTSTTANQRCILGAIEAEPAATSARTYFGLNGFSYNSTTSSLTATTGLVGGRFGTFVNAAATITGIAGLSVYAGTNGNGIAAAIINAYGVYLEAMDSDEATTQNVYGWYALSPTKSAAGTVVNTYGIYLNSYSLGTTLNYAIYTNLGDVRFGDDVLIASPNATALTIGAGTAGIDYQIKVDGETNDLLLTAMEDEDYWQFEDDVNLATGEVLKVAGTQVVGARVVDARIDDTPNSGDATTDGIIAAIQSVLQTHGLAAAA